MPLMFGDPLREMTGKIRPRRSSSRCALESYPLSPSRASGLRRGWPWAACDGRDSIDQGEGLSDVVHVRRSRDDLERGAASVADQVVLAARLPPVDRRRTGVGAPFFARMWEPSTHARDQSSSPAAFSSASRTWWSWSNTPAFCHRSKRRQQVCPEPNPSSGGRSCQATPL